jgi:hypothetical protein
VFSFIGVLSLTPYFRTDWPMTASSDVPAQPTLVARRSFLSRFGAGLAAFGGAFATAPVAALAQSQRVDPWQPTKHPQDDWLDQVRGQHRMFFDATSPTGAGDALTSASNFYYASKSGYNLGDADDAVVIGLRHWATPFAFGNAIWAKYGAVIGERIKFNDPKTNTTPVVNVYQAAGYGALLTNRDIPLSALVARGAHFAICDMATRSIAGLIATKLSLQTNAVYDEMRAAAVANSHFMSAGIVAVNRAQERKYTIQHIG